MQPNFNRQTRSARCHVRRAREVVSSAATGMMNSRGKVGIAPREAGGSVFAKAAIVSLFYKSRRIEA